MPSNQDKSVSRVSMKDVAIAAGVSQSTVSFVLNGREDMRIGDEARRRVLKAAQKLGYRPRPAGRPPKEAANGVIGIMFDEIATSPFAAITVEGAQERAWARDILLEVVMTGGDKEYESAILRKWSNDRVLGVIYSSILTRKIRAPEVLSMQKSVLLNCYEDVDRFPTIVPAERRGGEAATKALIAEGHENIAFITGESWMDASVQRQEGFERAMRASGRTINSDLIVQGNFLPSGGRLATLRLMSGSVKPDAIFCANDLTAVGCYEALKELGIAVGKQVAVMGYDDQEIAQHLTPALSTVLLPHREMGQWAVDAIVDGSDIAVKQERIECPLVLRKSHQRKKR